MSKKAEVLWLSQTDVIAAGGLDKEQMLFLCAESKAREGLEAYARADAQKKESLVKLAEGIRHVKQR